jgi:hypothetical protein
MTVIRAAVNFQTGENFEEQLEFALTTCPKDIRIKIKRIFAESLQIKDDQINNLLEEIAKYKPIAPPPLGKTSSSKESSLSNDPPVPSNKRKRRGGTENLDEGRNFLKQARGMPRLEYIQSLREKYPESNKLTESARTYMNRAVIPILQCLQTHHNNDKAAFLKKWPLTSGGLTTFLTKKCNCKGPVCGIA